MIKITKRAYVHNSFSLHDTGAGHAEQKARAAAMLSALNACPTWQKEQAERADLAHILRAHDQAYVEKIKAIDQDLQQNGNPDRLLALDEDTRMMSQSYQAALHAVGANLQAIDALCSGEIQRAYIAARPPGHHAERNRAMGFCIFSTIAIAALYALEQDNIERVAIVDFDVHHGNGTQDIIGDHPDILFISSHQMPLYPGTGRADETGRDNTVINIPLQEGSSGQEMRALYQEKVFPAIRAFKPDLLLVSAGFDAHNDDPLAGLCWDENDYAWLGAQLSALADECCQGRMLSSQEGGYNLEALTASIKAYLSAQEARS